MRPARPAGRVAPGRRTHHEHPDQGREGGDGITGAHENGSGAPRVAFAGTDWLGSPRHRRPMAEAPTRLRHRRRRIPPRGLSGSVFESRRSRNISGVTRRVGRLVLAS
jgi:hypothetical protein